MQKRNTAESFFFHLYNEQVSARFGYENFNISLALLCLHGAPLLFDHLFAFEFTLLAGIFVNIRPGNGLAGRGTSSRVACNRFIILLFDLNWRNLLSKQHKIYELRVILTSFQLFCFKAFNSLNKASTWLTWSITMSQNPSRSSLVVGNASPSLCK